VVNGLDTALHITALLHGLIVVPASSNTSSGGPSADDAKVEWIHESELVAELDEKGQKKCIGSGSFGTVFLASRDGDLVCVKMFNTGATCTLAAKAEHEKELVVHIQLPISASCSSSARAKSNLASALSSSISVAEAFTSSFSISIRTEAPSTGHCICGLRRKSLPV
jgi:hypothetical protein